MMISLRAPRTRLCGSSFLQTPRSLKVIGAAVLFLGAESGATPPMAVGLARQDTNAGGEAFPELSLVGQFGVLDGDPASEFGRLSDLAVDDLRGIVFVVDELVHKLSAFTKEGKFLAAIGCRTGIEMSGGRAK